MLMADCKVVLVSNKEDGQRPYKYKLRPGVTEPQFNVPDESLIVQGTQDSVR